MSSHYRDTELKVTYHSPTSTDIREGDSLSSAKGSAQADERSQLGPKLLASLSLAPSCYLDISVVSFFLGVLLVLVCTNRIVSSHHPFGYLARPIKLVWPPPASIHHLVVRMNSQNLLSKHS